MGASSATERNLGNTAQPFSRKDLIDAAGTLYVPPAAREDNVRTASGSARDKTRALSALTRDSIATGED